MPNDDAPLEPTGYPGPLRVIMGHVIDALTRVGRPREAENAARWAVALDEAQQALRVYA